MRIKTLLKNNFCLLVKIIRFHDYQNIKMITNSSQFSFRYKENAIILQNSFKNTQLSNKICILAKKNVNLSKK